MNKGIRSGLARVFPEALVAQIIWEVHSLLRHWQSWAVNRRKFKGKTDLKVNVGCGGKPLSGWVNLDLVNTPGIICWDCRRPLPLDSGSVSIIFSEHFFEHLDHPDATSRFLSECLRCLKPGGVLRIIVPDAGKYLRLYGGAWEPLMEIRSLSRESGTYRDPWLRCYYATQMELVNAVFRQGTEHRYSYDSETLSLVLRNAGFVNVVERSYGCSASLEKPLDSYERRKESLYFEATK